MKMNSKIGVVVLFGILIGITAVLKGCGTSENEKSISTIEGSDR